MQGHKGWTQLRDRLDTRPTPSLGRGSGAVAPGPRPRDGQGLHVTVGCKDAANQLALIGASAVLNSVIGPPSIISSFQDIIVRNIAVFQYGNFELHHRNNQIYSLTTSFPIDSKTSAFKNLNGEHDPSSPCPPIASTRSTLLSPMSFTMFRSSALSSTHFESAVKQNVWVVVVTTIP